MTTTETAPADFATIASDTVVGFGSDTPAAPPAAAAPVAPAEPAKPAAAEPAKTEAAAPAKDEKPSNGSLLGDKKEVADAPADDIKAEGMHADDLKAYKELLIENKVDSKVGQQILDKVRDTFGARIKANLAEAQSQWRAENAKDKTASTRVDAALSVVSKDVREALRNEAFVDHPALFRFVAEFGAFVEKATKQDTTVVGASPPAAPQFDPANTSSAAFAVGISGGF